MSALIVILLSAIAFLWDEWMDGCSGRANCELRGVTLFISLTDSVLFKGIHTDTH